MPRVPLDSVVEGAVLAEPVLDPMGRLLVPAGEVLTSAVLASLRRRGIPDVALAGPAAAAPVADLAALELLARRTPEGTARWERLAREASRWGEDPRMQVLREAVLRHTLPPAP
ncbi:MAG: hypothetical protein HY608_02335 [Planctomycetes bacterium]|nr:hypothetical protein [Planctomycetota bacterium]